MTTKFKIGDVLIYTGPNDSIECKYKITSIDEAGAFVDLFSNNKFYSKGYIADFSEYTLVSSVIDEKFELFYNNEV
jgi:hypothetical protein